MAEFTLTATCRAAGGIVAGVTGYLWSKGCYLEQLHQFDDQSTGRFFMRTVGTTPPGQPIEPVIEGFREVAAAFGMDWQFFDTSEPMRVMLMVSKADHCLSDILYRRRKGELPITVTRIVSNHPDLERIAIQENVPFTYLPVSADNRQAQESALLDLINETRSELIVLARYMQILSAALCEKLHGRVINIHHSFLPGFKGAKPYHQAHSRGVKLIGATAHYATSDLDEGPIIEQCVQPVDHTFTPKQLSALGRDTEQMALARAVRWHAEHRVFLDGNKTVIFK